MSTFAQAPVNSAPLVMLTRLHGGGFKANLPLRATTSDASTVEMALNNYAHLVPYGGAVSLGGLADSIGKHYDCEACPQNAEVVEALRRSHVLTEAAAREAAQA